MASASSLRSLMRPQFSSAPRIQSSIPSAASFSTTSVFYAGPVKKVVPGRKSTTKQPNQSKKKARALPKSSPAIGERKAYRKRIQLSNNSALEVKGLEPLTPETMSSSDGTCKMYALPDQVVDQLRALEAFKTTQTWNLFRKPHFLVRAEATQLAKDLDAAKNNNEALKLVLMGSKLSGKSMAVVQAMTHALLNEWAVIHIPEGFDLVCGNTEYSPVSGTEPIQFSQPTYTMKLLQATYKANKALFDKLELQNDWTRTTQFTQKKGTLSEFILSAKESDAAWPTFQAMWTELLLPGRPPVMFTLDGLSQINSISEYRDPSFKKVHSHDLTLIRTFVDALSGKTKFPNGAAIIAANSENNKFSHPSQNLVLAQLEAGQAGKEIPTPNPYERKYDERIYDALKNARVLRLEGLSHDESRVLMNYWAASGMMRKAVDHSTMLGQWTLGGHGIVGEMERGSLMTMRM